MLNFTRAMMSVRSQSRALQTGDVSFPEVTPPLLAIRRELNAEVVTCLFNLGTETVPVPAGLVSGHHGLLASGVPGDLPSELPANAVWIGRR